MRILPEGASAKKSSTSYELSGSPCAAISSASSDLVSAAWTRSIPRQAASSSASRTIEPFVVSLG